MKSRRLTLRWSVFPSCFFFLIRELKQATFRSQQTTTGSELFLSFTCLHNTIVVLLETQVLRDHGKVLHLSRPNGAIAIGEERSKADQFVGGRGQDYSLQSQDCHSKGYKQSKILYLILLLNKTVSCGTTPITLRKDF